MNQDEFFWLLTITLLIIPFVWFMTDSRTIPERFKTYLSLKSILFLFSELLIILSVYISIKYLPWPQTRSDGLLVVLGVLLFLKGLFVAVWAKFTMKSSWGLPGEFDAKRQKKIITEGPFSFSRNPIYLGLILLILGYTLAVRSYAVFLVPFIIYYFYSVILKEEKILTRHFGKKYLEYKLRVPRFFLKI